MNREWVIERLRARGLLHPAPAADPAARPGRSRSDFDLDPGGLPAELRGRKLKPAGVLVPLVNRPEGVTVLLTQRTAHLQKHAGQISFPGGGWEAGDPDLVATALRETEEEIGLPPSQVEVLGRLATYETSTAYGVAPVIGWIEPPFTLSIDPFEVAEAFEVPLAFILDVANHKRESAVRDGRERFFYVLPFENRYIWGATAGMLVNLAEALNA